MIARTSPPADSAPSTAEPCAVRHLGHARTRALQEALVDLTMATALAETFRVLADPTRLRILDALGHEELCVCDLAAVVGMSESAVSHQLRVLRSMRLVRSRRSGRMVFYTLDDEHITQLFALGVEHVSEVVPTGARTGRAPA